MFFFKGELCFRWCPPIVNLWGAALQLEGPEGTRGATGTTLRFPFALVVRLGLFRECENALVHPAAPLRRVIHDLAVLLLVLRCDGMLVAWHHEERCLPPFDDSLRRVVH